MNIQKATEIQSFLTKFPGHLKTGNKKLAFKFDVSTDDIKSIKEKLGFTGNSNKAYEKFRVKKLKYAERNRESIIEGFKNDGIVPIEGTWDDVLSAKEVKYEMPNILILDIETAPIRAYVWRLWKQDIYIDQIISEWFMISWSAKWLGVDSTYSDVLTPEEIIKEDDSRIVKGLWDLLNDAEIVIGHNCVEVNTPILKQDLTWCKAGELKVGDKLVGFEEGLPPGEPVRDKSKKWKSFGNKGRNVIPTEVTQFSLSKKECLEIKFENGDSVITTKDHYWLGMAENDRNLRWYRTDKLRIGQRINKFLTPYERDNSYEAGWLSGFIAGEGTLKGTKRHRGSSGSVSSIDFCQRPTSTLTQAVEYCNKLNIPISGLSTKKGGLGKGDTLYAYTLGGKWKTLEILGKLRINRLIEKINWLKFGGLSGNKGDNSPIQTNKIIDIVDVGIRDIAIISTSSKTYIASGYPMHNCDSFDIPKIRSRFAIHGLPPTTFYHQIDTKKIAAKEFGFSSNKLDALAKNFGLGQKVHTEFELWSECMKGNPEALENMRVYNVHDVELLEKVYLRLRPYIHNHPNVTLYSDGNPNRCPSCGGDKLHKEDFYYTTVGKFQVFRCQDCGALSRDRKAIKRGVVTSNLSLGR